MTSTIVLGNDSFIHNKNLGGYNNAYEAKLQTKTALVYFDTAILESMHASFLIKILKDPEIGFFELLPDLPVFCELEFSLPSL